MSKIELLSVYGSDTMVVDVARVSFDKKADNYTTEQNNRLLSYLAKHNHVSPFFHPKLNFRLQVPLYVERQLIKTQVGVEYNSISGRYCDFSDTYTLINEWRTQSKDSKQGSDGPVDNQLACKKIETRVIDTCKEAYSMLLGLGVSKEQARTILPLNLNTTMIWTGSLYAFIRLCKQRLKSDAQAETREIVAEMLRQLKENGNFAESLKVFDL